MSNFCPISRSDFLVIGIILGLCLVIGNGEAHPPAHFSEAKRLAKRIYSDHRRTFYCGCRYDKHGVVDLHSCGYQDQGNKRRAKRLEWEHIMPASFWGQSLPCWNEPLCCKKPTQCYKGRRCCREIDEQFSKMEADLHNLVPEIGELNGLRSNYAFSLLPNIEAGQFGLCEMKIDPDSRQAEPAPAVRGMIARAYLYMSATYQISLSESQQNLMAAWNAEYPPSTWEREWDKRVADVQGNHNTFITDY